MAEVLKAVYSAFKDKAPEVRVGAAKVLKALVQCSTGGVTTDKPSAAKEAGAVPLEATLVLCVKGLDDGSMAVKLAFADAIAVRIYHSNASLVLQQFTRLMPSIHTCVRSGSLS